MAHGLFFMYDIPKIKTKTHQNENKLKREFVDSNSDMLTVEKYLNNQIANDEIIVVMTTL